MFMATFMCFLFSFLYSVGLETSIFYILLMSNGELTEAGVFLAVWFANYYCFSFSVQPDDKYEFSDPVRIQNLVKNYSQFVSFPIYTWQEKSRTVEVTYFSFFLV
jgi:Hsp90 protein